MLSSMEAWDVVHGKFNLQKFYEIVVMLFDDPSDSWMIETLAWWNK
jgi:hypothetical protein